MLNKKFLVAFLAFTSLSFATSAALPTMGKPVDFTLDENAQDVLIHNRILLKVNGKSISVLDVAKKMDLLFYRQFPQYANSLRARYEFYMINWKAMLKSIIDDELILADAVEKKVEISEGDIREELEGLFGPDVVLNIDKAGLTFDEAWELLKKELTVRRMNAMMVRSKAMNDVGPKAIKEAYEEFIKSFSNEPVWNYRVLTIRGENVEEVESVKTQASEAFKETNDLQYVAGKLSKQFANTQVTLSEEYKRETKELSSQHKEILSSIESGILAAGKTLTQETKGSPSYVSRLFYLSSCEQKIPPSFASMKDQIQSELTQKAIATHLQNYLGKLRDQYGIPESYLAEALPKNFEPFALR